MHIPVGPVVHSRSALWPELLGSFGLLASKKKSTWTAGVRVVVLVGARGEDDEASDRPVAVLRRDVEGLASNAARTTGALQRRRRRERDRQQRHEPRGDESIGALEALASDHPGCPFDPKTPRRMTRRPSPDGRRTLCGRSLSTKGETGTRHRTVRVGPCSDATVQPRNVPDQGGPKVLLLGPSGTARGGPLRMPLGLQPRDSRRPYCRPRVGSSGHVASVIDQTPHPPGATSTAAKRSRIRRTR